MMMGLHPKGIKLAFCLSEREAFEELYKRRVVRSAATFHDWIIGRHKPRPEVLEKTYQAYEGLINEGAKILNPDAIAQHTITLD